MEKPKRSLFEDTKQSHGTVVLNWVGTPEREFKWYGEAYHEAGKALVEQLVEAGMVREYADLFALHQRRDELLALERMGGARERRRMSASRSTSQTAALGQSTKPLSR